MATSESTLAASTTFVDRVQGFVSENKRAILIGTAAAAIAIGGAAYYASTSRTTARGSGDPEKGEKKPKESKKKSSKGSKKRKTVKDPDGPILEERESPVQVADAPSKLYR